MIRNTLLFLHFIYVNHKLICKKESCNLSKHIFSIAIKQQNSNAFSFKSIFFVFYVYYTSRRNCHLIEENMKK